MAQQTINVGAAPNDGTGTPLRTAFQYTNQNFTELYTATGPSGNNIVVPGTATITGDLTVDTSTLKVDSTNDRVGIKNATPSFPLDLTGSGSNTPFRLLSGSGTSIRFDTSRNVGGANRNWIFGCDEYAEGTFALAPSTALGGATFTNPVYTVTSGGVHTFLDGAGGTRMTLNATGLGIGVASASISAKLHIDGNLKLNGATSEILMATGAERTISASGSASSTVLTFKRWNGTSYVSDVVMDGSGNLGIGVTPSAWSSIYKVSQIGQSASVSGGTSVELAVFGSNCYFDATDSRWERITSGFTSQYYQTNSTHVWRIGGNLGANTDCAFTQAMTLDASGNLLVGTTNTSASAGVGFKANYSATVPAFSVVVNDAAGTGAAYTLYNTNAAAYRFYVSNGGTIFATNTTISAISDARLKENVQDLDVGLNEVLALKPRKFDWKEGKGKNIKGDRGFIAQEFETVFPNLIDEWKDPAPEGEAPYKSVRQDLIPVLVKAIQELAAEVNALKKA